MSNINNWIVLHKLENELKSKIKFFYIFGGSGGEVLIVTNDDNVFGFGNNKNGLLGLGHNNNTENPTIVKELCNKQIIDIRCGEQHIIALTGNGLCYSWGFNTFGQLGNGSIVEENKPKLINGLINNKMEVIACGSNHSVVVTNNGEVYGFGRNDFGQIGCNNNEHQLTPILINGFNNEKVLSVSCGFNHTLALTESGHVFSCGYNFVGQLGIGNNNNQNTPQLVNMNGIIVSKIICGFAHSLLLTNDGNVYAIGHNGFGQIGNANKNNTSIPLKIVNNNKFISIASSLNNNISVAKSEKGFCYVWGECNNEVIFTPKETAFESIHEVLANCAVNKITYKPVYVKENSVNISIIGKLAKAFNNSELSDFQFKIDDKVIYVHKLILKINCEHFKAMFSQNWDKRDIKEIEIDLYSYSVYYAFLKYIYTNCVEIGIQDAIELYDLANSYFEEDLKQKCINIIKNNISIENAFTLYSSAVKYNSEELEDICLELAPISMNDICNTEAFKILDSNLFKRFIEKTLKKWKISFQRI